MQEIFDWCQLASNGDFLKKVFLGSPLLKDVTVHKVNLSLVSNLCDLSFTLSQFPEKYYDSRKFNKIRLDLDLSIIEEICIKSLNVAAAPPNKSEIRFFLDGKLIELTISGALNVSVKCGGVIIQKIVPYLAL